MDEDTKRVYHGCSIRNAARLLTALDSQAVAQLCVTETQRLASRYANAQATGEVRAEYRFPVPGAAIFEFEVRGQIEWWRRPADHRTLDVAEAIIDPRAARITSIGYHASDYTMLAFSDPACAWWLDDPQSDARALQIVRSHEVVRSERVP